MLYQWYETQRAMLAPFAEFASASSKLYSHPLSPFNHLPMAQRLSAGFDLLHRLAKEYEKPRFDITTVDIGGVDVAVQEQVRHEMPFCRLIRFKRFTDKAQALERMRDQPTILLVAPLSGHHSTLLRDTVKSLLQDHKVFITDWTDARMVPSEAGPFHLDDYVHYVQEFIRLIGASDVHVISVCQPTVPVFAAISLMASAGEKTPLTMTMMGGPIDARKSPTAVNNLAMNKSAEWFEHNVIYRVPQNYPGAGRRVYPGFMQHSGFVAMNPDRHLKSHYDYFLDLVQGDQDGADEHRGFYDEYNAVLDMPAEYYLDTIRTVFQEFALVDGSWRVRGKLVSPQDIKTTALLTVEGELDDISGAGQTRAAHDLCANIPPTRRFHYDVIGAGHYGIFSGRRWREKVYPEIRDFIRQFDVPNHPHAPLSRQPAQRKSASATRLGAKPPKATAVARTNGSAPRTSANTKPTKRGAGSGRSSRAPSASAAKRGRGA